MRKCLCHKDLRGFVYVFLPPYLMEWAQKTAVFMQMIRIMLLKMILFFCTIGRGEWYLISARGSLRERRGLHPEKIGESLEADYKCFN